MAKKLEMTKKQTNLIAKKIANIGGVEITFASAEENPYIALYDGKGETLLPMLVVERIAKKLIEGSERWTKAGLVAPPPPKSRKK